MSGYQAPLLRFAGLRTVQDPASFRYDKDSGACWLSACSNVDITDNLGVKVRDGYGVVTPQSIGHAHSAFGDHPHFAVYVEGDALTTRRSDGALTRLRNVTRNLPMSCTVDHELRAFHANGSESGYITPDGGEARAWVPPGERPSMDGESRILSPPPADIHIVAFCGARMLVGAGSFLFYSEPFDPFRFCLDEGNIPFGSRLRMIRKVASGYYIGTASGLVFLKGDDIADAKLEVIEQSPVIQGTDCKVDVDITMDGKPFHAKGVMVATERSILMLTDDGTKLDMSDGVITYPPGSSGSAFVKDGRYTVTINTF